MKAVCPVCANRLDWDAVLVEQEAGILPSKTIAWRKPEYRIPPAFSVRTLVFAILAAVVSLFFMLPQMGWTRPGEPNPNIILIPLLPALIVAGYGVVVANRKYRRMNICIWGVLVCLWLTPFVMFYRFWWREFVDYRCWSNLLQIHTAMKNYSYGNGAPPSTLILLILDGELGVDRVFVRHSQVDSASVRLGAWSIDDLERGRVSAPELHSLAKEVVTVSEWDRIGEFTFSRLCLDREQKDPALIVGISPVNPWTDERVVIHADGSMVAVPAKGAWVSNENQLRESLQLEPLPPLP